MKDSNRAAEDWKARVERIREHARAGEEPSWSEWGYGSQGVPPGEYQKALKLRNALLRKFKDKPLEDAIPGEVVSNRHGACYHIVTRHAMGFSTLSPRKARTGILSNLRLLYGIGEATETQLKKEGWLTLAELAGHNRWGDEARSLVELLDRGDIQGLQELVWHWFPKSHPLAFALVALHRHEEFVLLDIETLGLFGRAIILFGIARPVSDGLEIHQWLVRSMADERAALDEFRAMMGRGTAMLSYNGRAFDVPYVEERFGFYGELVTFDAPHFDLLHFSRRAWRDRLPDCRLDTLESHLLKVSRAENVPSALVPEFYQSYLRTQNVGPLTAIVAHNRQDLVSLARIFCKLCSEWEDESS